MKKFAKLCTVLYFVLVVVFGIFFGIYLMKQMGDDDNIAGQILYSLGGMVVCCIFSYFILTKIIGLFTKSGIAQDIIVFFFQLIITAVIVFLALNTEWANYSHQGEEKPVKEKCSWCGKYEELTNGWCDDCSEKAFGKDGWYNYEYKN